MAARGGAASEEAEAEALVGEYGGGEAPKGAPAWWVVVGLVSAAIATCYADRSNISTAAVAMAEELRWSKEGEGVVLSAFFLGYAATQLVGGRAADEYGGKVVLGLGVVAWSGATFCTPAAARLGLAPLLLARVALGLGEGVAFPAAHSLIARHVPPARKGAAVGAVTAASYAGAALAFGLSPPLVAKYGWPAAFYAFGLIAFAWIPLWLPIRLPAPQRGLGQRGGLSDAGAWRTLLALLGRREALAIIVAQYTQSVGLYGLLSWLPTYYADAYGVAIADLPALTVAPYVLQGCVGLSAGVAADALVARGRPVRDVRVGLQVVGMVGPAVALVAVAGAPSGSLSAGGAAALIDVALALSALTLGGVSANHLDIAPRNAGAVFGAGNTAATLAGLLAVPAIGALLDVTGDWSLVFGLTALHYAVGAAVFAWWAGGTPLPEDATTC